MARKRSGFHNQQLGEPYDRRGMTAPIDPRRSGGSRNRWFPTNPMTVGTDPDYRFTLANERTFLAWIRTALALSAGGLAALTLLDDIRGHELLGVALLVISFLTAATSYRRWALNEQAMRLGVPLPPSRLPLVMTVGVAVIALITAVVAAIA